MARGFVMGAVWGTLVAGFGAAALSIVAGPPVNEPMAPKPVETSALTTPAAKVEAPAEAGATEPVAETPTAESQAEPAEPQAEPAEPGRRPVAETGVAMPEQPMTMADAPSAPAQVGADTAPLAAPQVGEAPTAPEGATEGQGTGVSVASDAPVLPGAQAQAPGMPTLEADPQIATEPAQPPLPQVPQAETALVTEAPEAVEPAVDEPAAQPAATEPATPEDSATSERPAIGTPVGTLTDRDGAVPKGRLPSIGAGEPETAVTESTAEAVATDLPPESPLVRFAADVEAAPGLPRMAVILIDQGDGPLGPDALGGFPFPVTFAIDPASPDAATRAAEYRDMGFEVMALATMPQGAQASDVEVILAGVLGAIPEAVAVLEDPKGGIQDSRAVSTQAATFLAASGHGLVMLPKGLNTAQQLAAKEGVPSATLFRDFDGEGQDARVIRRFLDQAAFRANQEGAVVMLGRLRADTVSALLLWGLQDRAASVALVPVSLVLREAAGGQ